MPTMVYRESCHSLMLVRLNNNSHNSNVQLHRHTNNSMMCLGFSCSQLCKPNLFQPWLPAQLSALKSSHSYLSG